MEPDKTTPPTDEKPSTSSDAQAPADALSRTPEELAEEQAETNPVPAADPNEKKLPFFKRLFRRVNVYLLIFILLVVVAAIIAIVSYLNSQKTPATPSVASQTLTQSALSQLAKTNASVGASSQTLTIKGNAVINGQTLTRGDLNVAGNIQAAGTLTAPSLTISGTSNLGTAQINSLQVAGATALQGAVTAGSLSVSGTTSLSGPVTASQITVTKLIISGNGVLQVPNHISFPGASPNRSSIGNAALGAGGTASIAGSDTTGTLNINTGAGTAPGCFISVSFNQAFANQPHVIVTPVGAAAGQTQYYVTRNNSGFSICTNNAAPANQVFAFDYFVTD